jgi:thiamine biosynthesis lipoprotein
MRRALAWLGLLAACRTPQSGGVPAPEPVTASHFAMGSPVTLIIYAEDVGKAERAVKQVFQEFDRLEALLTVWKQTSDVARINQSAGVAPVQVQRDTIDVLLRAKELSELTDGTFDVTFGAMSGLWKFDHDQDNQIPPHEAIERQRSLIDSRKLIVDPAKGTAFLERPGMKVHLGGIGKGFGVDHAVQILLAQGFSSFLIQAGGDLYVRGTRGGEPWRLGIRDPRGPTDRAFAKADIRDATFSTSGDYERFFIKDGRRYHHIIDPRTGEPARGLRSVTIMAKDATTAEGLSKGVFILGVERGLEMIERVDGAGCVIVDDKNQVHISKRLEGKVQILSPPTDGV